MRRQDPTPKRATRSTWISGARPPTASSNVGEDIETDIITTISSSVKVAYSAAFPVEDFIVLCTWPLYSTGHGASVLCR